MANEYKVEETKFGTRTSHPSYALCYLTELMWKDTIIRKQH